MVEKVKQPETQEETSTTTSNPTDKTSTTTTARDATEETSLAFLQELGEQYISPTKADGTKANKDGVEEPKPSVDGEEKKPNAPDTQAPKPEIRKEPDLIEFPNVFAKPLEEPAPMGRAPYGAIPPEEPAPQGRARYGAVPPEIPRTGGDRDLSSEPRQRELFGQGDLPGGKDGIDIKGLEEKIKEIQVLMALEAAKFIKKEGVEPKGAILDAVKNNNVTFLGEMHTIGVENPHRKLITETLKEMPKGSRLAIELPDVLKPVFDKFNEGKPGSDLEIPDKLEGEFGKEALELLKLVKEKSPDLIDMWKAARDNGIKVSPIDNNSLIMKDGDPRKAVDTAKRDEYMKTKLLEMVKADPTSHVVAELGSLHAARSQDGKKPQSAADLLTHDPEFKKLNGKIETFSGQIGQGHGVGSPLWFATLELEKPLSVKTKGADGKPNPVGSMPIFSDPGQNSVFGYDLNAYDNVITYPFSQADLLKALEPPKGLGDMPPADGRDGGRPRSDRDLYDTPRTREQDRRDMEEYERRRKPEIEQRSKDIKGMKDLKIEPSVKPEQYLDPTPSKSEIETMGVSPENAAKVKAEVNKNGMTPEKALGDAMKSSRVVGLENPQMDWKQNLDFSMKAFKALKDGGATHAVFNLPESMKPLLDEFNKTGVVDRTKLNTNANTDYDAASMQAALSNGLKIVAGGQEAFIDNGNSEARAKTVQDILKSDKNAKIVLVAGDEPLASGKDERGNPSTVQRLRDAGVPVKTAKVTLADGWDEKTAVLGRTLKEPVAIPTDKSPTLANLKAGLFGELKVGSWDIDIIMPDVKKK